MAEDTRKLLKVFGVSVTDFEAEAERLKARVAALSSASGNEATQLLKDLSELCQEVNTRWFEVTSRLHELQSELLRQVAQSAGKNL